MNYLSVRPLVLRNTLSHIWDRLNLPMLLFKEGLLATTLPSLPTMECKVRVTLSYPTHKFFVKVSKGSVVDMASKLTSRVAKPSKTFWSPLRTRTLCSTKVVPYTGTNATT